jgi:exopolyphosphatase/guanosine-5'-triphosphate,3'-diphosphate pyrophosphatase
VRVITGGEEARLIFLGVQHSMTLTERPILVVDVGGGSVELVAGNRDRLMRGCSLKLGAIRLKDLYLQRNPNSKSMQKQMRSLIRAQLEEALKDFRRLRFERIVATSGMAGNLAEVIHLDRAGRPLPQLNLATVTRKDLEVMETRLGRSSPKERLAIPGIDPKRVDTLFPAAIVLRMVLELCGAEELTISDKAIREGVIYDFIQRHREKIKAEQEIPDVRRRNVIGLARRCQVPLDHGDHVAKLALQLFDQTRAVHGYGRKEREWLEYAALLHDAGYMINPRQHHKHTYYLIKHSDLSGFQSDEIEIIANVARYHRRSHPQRKHVAYGALSSASRRIIDTLSAMLRVADGLDRSHFAVVRSLQVRLGATITVSLQTAGDVELELWAAKGRADLLEKVLGRRVQFLKVRATGAAA